jgi:hypothetical protein
MLDVERAAARAARDRGRRLVGLASFSVGRLRAAL